MAKLTGKQNVFCKEFLVDLNGTQAAIRAGYSKKTARTTAAEYLAKPHIQQQIQKLMDKRADRTEVKIDAVVTELAKVAFANMGEYLSFGEDGLVLNESEQLTKDQLAAIVQVTDRSTSRQEGGKDSKAVITSRNLGFKLHDKLKALELLMRHLVRDESGADEVVKLILEYVD